MSLNIRTGQGAKPELIELIRALGNAKGMFAFWVDHDGEVRFTQEGNTAVAHPQRVMTFGGIIEFNDQHTPADLAANIQAVDAMLETLVAAWG